jgi:hypothetical protein
MEEILAISTINVIVANIKKRIIIVNRCQRRCYKQTRNKVIKRILVKDEYKRYTKLDPFIVPYLILESPNVTRLWATFKFDNEDKITVENSVITIRVKGFKLISELNEHVGVEPKPIAQLNQEYEELLNMNEECDYEI